MQIYQKKEITTIAQQLKAGAIIAFPTDTVFGLGCLMEDEKANQRIYQAKGRSFAKALPIMCADIAMLECIAETDAKSLRLLAKLTPGPLTLILKKRNSEDTIAIRIPNDPFVIELIKAVGKPLSVTSANLSDQGSLQHFAEVREQLAGRIDGIVEGDAQSTCSSTIVDCLHDFAILRQGDISAKQIEEALYE